MKRRNAMGLTLRSVRCMPVEVPMRYVLGTSAATVRSAPLLLLDVQTEEGVVGRAYSFAYKPSSARALVPVLHEMLELVTGDAVAPLAVMRKIQGSYRLLGVTGIVRLAQSLLDMALWDALAIAAGKPLALLLGGEARAVRAYNSCGLGLMGPRPRQRRRCACSKTASRR